MLVVTLRKLTRLSKLNFGKYKDSTVETLLGMRKEKALISSYFKLGKITFVDDILDQLGITEEFRIAKPGTDFEKFYTFMDLKYGERYVRNKQLLKMRKEPRVCPKAYLMNKNHGK